ncbi:glycosyl transferase, group 2 family protein [Lentisphaera araneosa HTCC2155]|uniref:Glycosyl transferase, group 2 family protein n=2 Tax=Lentisphaera TaxID=256846 RepID=A6DHF7_9BACT|nr:glycosyl transferase, group 2 family protein [Lentisphaera araneosa HTCC2155]
MPVYNAENHLQRCLDTVLQQTFRDFEVILINDGSKDRTGLVCDRNAELDTRIKVIHKENGGTSSARNEGLKIATGKYIGFVDSDDWLELDMYKVMMEKTEKHDVDLLISDYKRVYEDYAFEVVQPIREGYYNKDDMLKEYFPCLLMREDIDYPPTISNWACLFRKKLLNDNDIWYDTKTKYNEDFLFGAKAAYHAKSLYHLKGHHNYNFYFNPYSTTAVYNTDKWGINLHVYEEAKNLFGNISEFDFTQQLKTTMIFFSFNAINEVAKSKVGFFKRYKEIKNILKHPYLKEAFHNYKYPKVKYKLRIMLFLHKYRQAFLVTLKQKF